MLMLDGLSNVIAKLPFLFCRSRPNARSQCQDLGTCSSTPPNPQRRIVICNLWYNVALDEEIAGAKNAKCDMIPSLIPSYGPVHLEQTPFLLPLFLISAFFTSGRLCQE